MTKETGVLATIGVLQMNVENTNWDFDEPYEISIARIKAISVRAGTKGYNEYGVPLHACHGYKHDAHVWVWIGSGKLEKGNTYYTHWQRLPTFKKDEK